MQLPCLPICNYGYGFVSWTASVATRLTSSSNNSVTIVFLKLQSRFVTLHEKTKHIALTINFELRLPLPTTTFELLILQI